MLLVERVFVPNSPRRRSRPPDEPKTREFPRVADALRAIRKARNLTQEDMAPILGISFAGYRPYERGERDLTQSQIEMLAVGTGLSVFEITRLLWPPEERDEDDAASHRTLRFSDDWDAIQREVEDLPPELAESVLRTFKNALEIASLPRKSREN